MLDFMYVHSLMIVHMWFDQQDMLVVHVLYSVSLYGGVGKWEETYCISYVQKLELLGCRPATSSSEILCE